MVKQIAKMKTAEPQILFESNLTIPLSSNTMGVKINIKIPKAKPICHLGILPSNFIIFR